MWGKANAEMKNHSVVSTSHCLLTNSIQWTLDSVIRPTSFCLNPCSAPYEQEKQLGC